MRGKVQAQSRDWKPERITPACAGKRFEKDPTEKGYKDHPRMCGEKLYTPCMIAPKVGSPPHVRGKEISDIETAKKMGITPACAGKSALLNALIAVPSGSPPHVRGKEVDTVAKTAVAGITPACAGKRLKRSRSTVPYAAIVPLFPSVCNKPAGSDGSPAGHDAPPFLPIENAAPASPAYNLRSL